MLFKFTANCTVEAESADDALRMLIDHFAAVINDEPTRLILTPSRWEVREQREDGTAGEFMLGSA